MDDALGVGIRSLLDAESDFVDALALAPAA